jgi:hypothetical protein
MRIAVLILAHKNVWQLEKLVERLNPDFDVYIHADEKWNLDTDLFKKYDNVFFVKRHSVNWGSYIQILATIELFKGASIKDYDYYLLISGLDVPIKSNAFIKEFVRKNLGTSYVNSELLPKKEWAGQGGGFDRLHYYFGIDFKNNLLGILQRKALSFTQRIQLKYGIKRKLYPVKYYGGWNWVNLDRSAMLYLLDFLKQQPAFLRSFKYTYCADEIWLQSVLLNSPLLIINNNMRYTSWEEHASHPKTLVVSDLKDLQNSEDLFARKFDSELDREVINMVYQMTE